MSTETTNKKIKIDNGTTFGRTYTDKAIDAKLPTDLIASANKLSLGVGNSPLGNGVNLSGFTYDEATKTLKASGGEGGVSVIELTDKNGTIASTQLGEINADPQNFAFKYNGKILLFTSADSTTYQYCNNTTSSSDNNVMTTSTLLTITSSTGAYTIAENIHNVVANSIHPANGGDLKNIQVGSKVYSIPSSGGGGGSTIKTTYTYDSFTCDKPSSNIEANVGYAIRTYVKKLDDNELPMLLEATGIITIGTAKFIKVPINWLFGSNDRGQAIDLICIVAGTIPAGTSIRVDVKRVRVVSE